MSLDDLGSQRFDAIIVGGRIAGSSIAIQLARQGKRVLVVDRARFPQPTVSTHLMKPDSVAMLEKLGLIERIRELGAPELRKFRQDFQGFCIEGHFSNGEKPTFGWCIRRETLDQVLVDYASDQPGVYFLQGCQILDLIWDHNRVIGVSGSYQGRSITLRSHIVIGADGRYSLVARLVHAKVFWQVPIGRMAFYGYFRHVVPAPEPSIEIFIRGSTWLYLFPTDGDLCMVAIGIDHHQGPYIQTNRLQGFMDIMQKCPELMQRLSHAELVNKIYLAHSLQSTNHMRRPFGPGWALVGDAGMYIDPMLGQGMGSALRSAELLAEELAPVFAKDDWDCLRHYEKRRNAAFWDLYAYTCTMSPARSITGIERIMYQRIGKNPHLTQQYLGVVSHTTRVSDFIRYALSHPWDFALS